MPRRLTFQARADKRQPPVTRALTDQEKLARSRELQALRASRSPGETGLTPTGNPYYIDHRGVSLPLIRGYSNPAAERLDADGW